MNGIKQINPKCIYIKRFFSYKPAVLSVFLITIIICMAIFAPIITPYDKNHTDPYNTRKAPDEIHILGTDDVGRDVFSRLLYASRISLLVGFFSMLIQVFVGILLGILAGYFGGVIEIIIFRVVDLFMCFPFIIIVMTVISIIGGGMINLIMVLGLFSWPSISRIVRNEVLQIRNNDYIKSAYAMGLHHIEIIVKHILPNIASAIFTTSSLAVANGILAEAALSFLGIGIMPPTPSWGNMLKLASNIVVLKNEWWLYVPVGIMVILTTLSIHFIAEGLKITFSPKKQYL